MTRLIAVGASCAFAGFLAGIIVCYLWFQIQTSPAVTNLRSDPSETGLATTETGGKERTARGNINARAGKFEALDLDRDGGLSLIEFAGGRKPAEAEKWFKLRDVNKDGFVSRDEFLPISAAPKEAQ